jgi:GNAT superfamily N-acetyltransferase
MEATPHRDQETSIMIHADHALARRLEGLIRTEYRRLAEVGRDVFTGGGTECIEAAGGVALWLTDRSPVNCAAGLGMTGPVDEAEIQRLETFYHERGADAVASVCTLADPSLIAVLGRRGWSASEFEHVLVLDLDEVRVRGEGDAGAAAEPAAAGAGPAGVEVRVCTPAERSVWAQVAGMGFAEGEVPGPGGVEFGRVMTAREEAVLLLAWVDGEPAGTGALVVNGGVGWLSADSTLPAHRGRGVQQAVQRHRLELARVAGCDLAVTESEPGSGSQRNMERVGFRIAYTHVEFRLRRP